MMETYSSIFTGLAILAILSWACGSHSFIGRRLTLRMTPLWVGCRSFGLGVFIATAVLIGTKTQIPAEYWMLHSIGCIALAIGCARKRVKRDDTLSSITGNSLQHEKQH